MFSLHIGAFAVGDREGSSGSTPEVRPNFRDKFATRAPVHLGRWRSSEAEEDELVAAALAVAGERVRPALEAVTGVPFLGVDLHAVSSPELLDCLEDVHVVGLDADAAQLVSQVDPPIGRDRAAEQEEAGDEVDELLGVEDARRPPALLLAAARRAEFLSLGAVA